MSSVNAVMASEKMSEARVGGSPAATSGATNPGSARAGDAVAGRRDPEATRTTAPLGEDEVGRLDIAVDDGRSCLCKNVRASAAWARARRTVEGANPGVPCSASSFANWVPSIQSTTMM